MSTVVFYGQKGIKKGGIIDTIKTTGNVCLDNDPFNSWDTD